MKKFFLLSVALLIAGIALANTTTFDFRGNTDKYGLPINTVKPATKMAPAPYTIPQDGVNLILNRTSSTGGFALTYLSDSQQGLQVTPGTSDPTITVEIPNGYTTQVTLLSNGSRTIKVDGETLPKGDGYQYTWKGKSNSVTFNLANVPTGGVAAFYYTITVEYTIDDPNKKDADISFNELSAKGILGQDFTPPTVNNPNNLKLIWSSSNTDVATVNDEGNITMKGVGETDIKVTSLATDEFNEGYATYTLTVIPVVNNIKELIKGAPQTGMEAIIDFESTVMFANNLYIFVVDNEGNATQYFVINNKCKIGDIIPGGWTAVNNGNSTTVSYEGKLPEITTGITNIHYPSQYTLTPDDNNRVLILSNVVLKQDSPASSTTLEVTLPDGISAKIMNLFNNEIMPAGTYDILCAVKSYVSLSKQNYYIYPIEYRTPASSETVDLKKDIIGLTKLVSSSIATNLELPYSVTVDNSTVEFISHSESTPEKSGLEISQSGVYVNKGSADMRVAANGKKIFKIIFNANSAMTFMVDGNILPTDGSYSYVWYSPQNYTKDYIDVICTTTARKYLKNITIYYEDAAVVPSPGIYPDLYEVSVDGDDIVVTQQIDSNGLHHIDLSGSFEGDVINFSIEVPDGWNNFVCGYGGLDLPTNSSVKKVKAPEWTPVSTLIEDGMALTNSIPLPSDVPFSVTYYLVKGENADTANPIFVTGYIKKSSTGISEIEEASDEIRYINCGGIESKSPLPGIYVKISGNKAEKVIIR